MRKNLRIQILAVLALAVVTTGCGVQRFVNAVSWKDTDTLYMAYSEVGAFATDAKVQKCNRRDDNSMTCKEQDSLNAVLNK